MADQLDGLRLRRILGQFTTGVTIVTTPEGEAVHGMTLNAFVPLSLDPPLIAISLAKSSRMHSVLAESRRYVVNILSAIQGQASAHFAGSQTPDYSPQFSWISGLPVLDGALAYLGASVVDVLPVGDHSLYVGQVELQHAADTAPLVFYNGRYRALTEAYDPSQYVDAWSMFHVVP